MKSNALARSSIDYCFPENLCISRVYRIGNAKRTNRLTRWMYIILPL